MKYITIYGNMTRRKIVSDGKTYWLAQDSDILCKGFFLLEKKWNNCYTVLRILKMDSIEDSDGNSGD